MEKTKKEMKSNKLVVSYYNRVSGKNDMKNKKREKNRLKNKVEKQSKVVNNQTSCYLPKGTSVKINDSPCTPFKVECEREKIKSEIKTKVEKFKDIYSIGKQEDRAVQPGDIGVVIKSSRERISIDFGKDKGQWEISSKCVDVVELPKKKE